MNVSTVLSVAAFLVSAFALYESRLQRPDISLLPELAPPTFGVSEIEISGPKGLNVVAPLIAINSGANPGIILEVTAEVFGLPFDMGTGPARCEFEQGPIAGGEVRMLPVTVYLEPRPPMDFKVHGQWMKLFYAFQKAVKAGERLQVNLIYTYVKGLSIRPNRNSLVTRTRTVSLSVAMDGVYESMSTFIRLGGALRLPETLLDIKNR